MTACPPPRKPDLTLLLSAAGAVIGLGFAGHGLFTAAGTRSGLMAPENAATVNGVPILREDFIQQLSSLYDVGLSAATPAQRRRVLDDMIREELLVQRGVELGLVSDDTDVRTALVSGMEGQMNQEADAEPVSPEEMRRWYDRHRDSYSEEGTMAVTEWLLPAGRGAPPAVLPALRAGRSPQSLGLVETGRTADGEELYFAARAHLGDELFATARALNDGELTGPVIQRDGAHFLRMTANRRPVAIPFAEARDKVIADIRKDRVARGMAENDRFLRDRAEIKTADDLR
jgi:parvulin-like peptidyl-prolyl isomerase